ncbi:uncharacterized protein KY384_007721 [Bacidia gigantensis]|uniref:uncharacterized protein n=1 Tax=Bacidia gigantensis TaxID=2732470 RepID=UPI001D038E22|nr:uncharacterized protein KY384_007721 [Bacidia gigantensis]KAG8527568.1 hypothetical protein KY384_007721 [Bacidia gigantensis]
MGSSTHSTPQGRRHSSRLHSTNAGPTVSSSPCTTPKVVVTKSPPNWNFAVPVSKDMVMEDMRQTRSKPRVTYEISSDSEGSGESLGDGSSFSSPEKPPLVIIDEQDDSEHSESPPPPAMKLRESAAGHNLRQPGVLQQPRHVLENGDRRPRRKAKRSKTTGQSNKLTTKNYDVTAQTERSHIRQHISSVTTRDRANFFMSKANVFLPLLPQDNFIKRLLEKAPKTSEPSSHISVPYQVINKQPTGVKATMKPYQLLGLSFLVYLYRNGVGGVLGDEMGLGKTLQTLALFSYLKEHTQQSQSGQSRPSLVVCPLSVLNSWISEARKWTPDMKVLRFHGPRHERDRLKKVATGGFYSQGKPRTQTAFDRTAKRRPIIDLESEDELASSTNGGPDLIVTTYEGFLAEEGWFKRAFVWKYVVLDEGHKIKNDVSLISKALQGLGAEYRLILTGTPLQNNLLELWALLHWLYPEVFTEKTQELFKKSFNLSQGRVSTKAMDDSRRLLEEVMLRRMKDSPGVDLNLPKKTSVLLYCPLTPLQEFWYMRLLTRTDKGLLDELFKGGQNIESKDEPVTSTLEVEKSFLEPISGDQTAAPWDESKEMMKQAVVREQQEESKSPAWRKLMNLLMQLRKCCNHPYVLPNAEPDPYTPGEHVIHASGKFVVLEKMLDQLVIKQKRKIIIFSGFTAMLNCVEDLLALRGGTGEIFRYARLDGGTSRARRNLSIRMFNSDETNYRVFLISTRAGGLGINLAAASDVIMLDQDFNPQITLQAEARAHRIGQTKPVTVYKLCTQGTVEEQMLGRIQKKLYLSTKVMESMRNIHTTWKTDGGFDELSAEPDTSMPHLQTEQLMSLVRRGAQALARPQLKVDEMLSWDFETMLENCKDKPADYLVAQQTNVEYKKEDEEKWLSQIEHVQSRVFNGRKHKSNQSTAEIAQEWKREERRKGKHTTVMVGGYAISKESMSCGDWEAVPTLAGKDPRLAEPKRAKKAEVVNQIAKINFACPQHQCADCEQKTGDAGGMLYRCRWCEKGYCEDCLDWEKTDLLGESLKEYEILGFPSIVQAYYVKCPDCTEHHSESSEARTFCADRSQEIDDEYEELLNHQELLAAATEVAGPQIAGSDGPDSPGSLTEGPTLDSSGISTPGLAPKVSAESTSKKRKMHIGLTRGDRNPKKRLSNPASRLKIANVEP